MPARHPIILNGMGLRGLMNAAADAMIAASVDAVSKAQDDDNAQDLKEQFERQQLEEKMSTAGFIYDPAVNQFR